MCGGTRKNEHTRSVSNCRTAMNCESWFVDCSNGRAFTPPSSTAVRWALIGPRWIRSQLSRSRSTVSTSRL